jgi:hypothetical protein
MFGMESSVIGVTTMTPEEHVDELKFCGMPSNSNSRRVDST